MDPRYFETVGTHILSGRTITDADMFGKHMVAVVNQTFVTKLMHGANPVGKQVRIDIFEQAPVPIKNPWFEIVASCPTCAIADWSIRQCRKHTLP